MVIGLKYEGKEEYRYLIASDLSWRTQDVVQAHTLRWLVVGSLLERIRVESLIEFIRKLLLSENPQHKLGLLAKTLEDLFQLRPSKKHMNNRYLGRLKPIPSLKYRALRAYAFA